MIGGGVPRNQIAHKLICFGANDVNVFQGTKSGVAKQIKDNYVLHFIGVSYMAHHTNLAMQTLSRLPLVIQLENLLQTLDSYKFAHSPKRHLELTKLVKLMQTKGNNIFWNVKIRWIFMLSFAKIVMAKYKTLLMKMALDSPTNRQIKLNYENLCDLQVLLGLVFILSLLESVHALIKFAQMRISMCVI